MLAFLLTYNWDDQLTVRWFGMPVPAAIDPSHVGSRGLAALLQHAIGVSDAEFSAHEP